MEERNVSRNPAHRDELIKLGYTSVPVTIVGGQTIVGFDPAKLKTALSAVSR